MSLSVAANPANPVANAAACLAACAGDAAPAGGFAALLQSLSAPGEVPLAIPPEIAALLDAPDAPAGLDGEPPADPLQNLLAGLLALQATGAEPAARLPAGVGSGLTETSGTDLLASKAKRLPPAAIDAQKIAHGADPEAAAKAPRSGDVVATGLPVAAKLADRGAPAAIGIDVSAAAGDSPESNPQFVASLASAAANRPGTAANPALTAHVATPVGNPAWATDFSQRIVMLARGDTQSAQITLNPAHLGPIEVRLSLAGGEATAVFVSPHGDVREALESALPRLREMFAGAGISLGQAQVNAQSQGSGGQQQTAQNGATMADRTELGGPLADNDAGSRVVPLARGLVDTFA